MTTEERFRDELLDLLREAGAYLTTATKRDTAVTLVAEGLGLVDPKERRAIVQRAIHELEEE